MHSKVQKLLGRGCAYGSLSPGLWHPHQQYISPPRQCNTVARGKHHFNKDPPNAKFYFPGDGCERPTTFHHLLITQVQRIYTLAASLAGDEPTYADIFRAFSTEFDLPDTMYNVTLPANDYGNAVVGGAEECRELCRGEDQCVGWSYDQGRCWKKVGIVEQRKKEGVVSGMFPEKYRCRERASE